MRNAGGLRVETSMDWKELAKLNTRNVGSWKAGVSELQALGQLNDRVCVA